MKDEQGKVVKPGNYTVCIEAAREHGTYQLMRQPVDIGNADKQITVPINGVEVTAASVDYHKATGK
jgi:FAD:protein FMN transferase